jgi:hypothetical protein
MTRSYSWGRIPHSAFFMSERCRRSAYVRMYVSISTDRLHSMRTDVFILLQAGPRINRERPRSLHRDAIFQKLSFDVSPRLRPNEGRQRRDDTVPGHRHGLRDAGEARGE